jgi:N-acetylneuraminate synthase/N,N'-diacetyllegionaminate synthase
MRKIRIGDRIIGNEEPTFIIAEAGINHNGNIELAKKLIQEAAIAGANAVKFQMFKAEEFCSKNSEYFELFKTQEFSEDEWIEIAEFAKDIGIIFTASVFGEESADLLDKVESPVYKIASGDLTHLPLLNYVARKNKPIILSTGMSTIGEIEEAMSEIYKTGNQQLALLHCVSNYPTKYEETNLRTIQTLKDTFKVPVGFSDHTVGTIISAVTVAMGANIIEKHFTLDKNLSGPDHKLSLEPHEFREMIENIMAVERALGDGIKKPTKDEENIKKLVRRSITAKVEIPEKTIITKDKIKIVRPENGIEPKFVGLVVGRSAKKNIAQDETIKWDAV